MMGTIARVSVCALLSTLAFDCIQAAPPTPTMTPMTPDIVTKYEVMRPQADFIKREEMIPMRDGVKLYTVIVMKKGVARAPILLSRTPYSAAKSTERVGSQSITEVLPVMDAEFAEDGYIRVYQDIRGMYKSEGEYIMTRPLAGPLNATGIDESTDAYDTIDWLVKNVSENNGNVGVIGSSYLGFTTLMAEINPHPALKAAAPQSPMVDGWRGDDWFHNGAFRTKGLAYSLSQSWDKGKGGDPAIGAGDDYTTYLQAGSTGDFVRNWGFDSVPFVQKLMQNPAYTDFWSLQAVDKWMAQQPVKVPTMLIVGQWDQEDSYGAPAVYQVMEPKDEHNDKVFLVIGPWRHSGVNHYGYDLGAATFAGDTAKQFRLKYLKPFFDHYLKGTPNPTTPPVLTYATGIDQWESSPRWPMGTPTPLYLNRDFTASFDKPKAGGHDDYQSNPAKPVPFIPRPINMNDPKQWKPWLVGDQRFVSDRPDVLVYQTPTLEQATHIMGAPQVDLFAATSGTDSDWVVKLIDVYPNSTPEGSDQGGKSGMAGFELPIGIEIFRGRYVRSLAQPTALTPGKIEEYNFALTNVDHVFLPGHRIMVQVQSSLFPLYDRNPQTFVENIFNAKPSDYRLATQSIFWGGTHATKIVLPIAY